MITATDVNIGNQNIPATRYRCARHPRMVELTASGKRLRFVAAEDMGAGIWRTYERRGGNSYYIMMTSCSSGAPADLLAEFRKHRPDPAYPELLQCFPDYREHHEDEWED